MASEKPMEDVARYIHGEMINNLHAVSVEKVRMANQKAHDVNFFTLRNVIVPGGFQESVLDYSIKKVSAYGMFIELVKPGGVMDHKAEIKDRFGEYSFDKIGNRKYFFDIWSNLHYGFIGAWCEFSTTELASGAGAAQAWASVKGNNVVPEGYIGRLSSSGNPFKALDDPLDQAAIQLGINLWSRYGSALSLRDFLSNIRRHAPVLNTVSVLTLPKALLLPPRRHGR